MQYKDYSLSDFNIKHKACKKCGELPVLRVYYYETGQVIKKITCPNECREQEKVDIDIDQLKKMVNEWNKNN